MAWSQVLLELDTIVTELETPSSNFTSNYRPVLSSERSPILKIWKCLKIISTEEKEIFVADPKWLPDTRPDF
jgi:hypothetical protein